MMRYSRNRLSDTSCARRMSYERNGGGASCNRRENANTCECGRERTPSYTDGSRETVIPYGYDCNRERESRCRASECGATARQENGNACEGEALLTLIRRLDFALVEVNLYLDTHPYSRTALNYFERLLCERKQAADRYEATFGPLTAMAGGMHEEWTWSTGAWPWQIDKESKR